MGGIVLVPYPMFAWYLTPDGWKQVFMLHPTVEVPPESWRAHLEAVFEAAEGRTMAALERQKED
jgi:hypothetical protein